VSQKCTLYLGGNNGRHVPDAIVFATSTNDITGRLYAVLTSGACDLYKHDREVCWHVYIGQREGMAADHMTIVSKSFEPVHYATRDEVFKTYSNDARWTLL